MFDDASHHRFIETHRDRITTYLGEEAAVLRRRYLLLTDQNQCAALLLDVFKTQTDCKTQDYIVYTLSDLQAMLFHLYSLSDICQALRLLIQRGYIYHAPPLKINSNDYEKSTSMSLVPLNGGHHFAYKRPLIDERKGGSFTFLVDRPKIKILSEICNDFCHPARREIFTKALQKQYKSEDARVAHQRYLAEKEALPATLTLHQWKNTLTYFRGCCAYCGGIYHVIEHYVPLVHGGGTVVIFSRVPIISFLCNLLVSSFEWV